MIDQELDSGEIPKSDLPTREPGFIKFYGIFWRKDLVDWNMKQLLGQPGGWQGGRVAKDYDRATLQMNFWDQKGVYILYDQNLHPVYAGQAGLSRSDSRENNPIQGIGNRLATHQRQVFKNAWSLFSWFGFLSVDKIKLRDASDDQRLKPKWEFKPEQKSELNDLLASFEAILIEGFSPRFNARGGDLKKANLVDQFERQRSEGNNR